MTNQKTALVLGATGGLGGEVARALGGRGWNVRAMSRHPREQDGFDWRRGDAMVARDVADAAEGVDVIVHAVNPAGYRDWDKLVLPMVDNTIAAAKANGATIVLPGNVYNYGPDSFPVVREDAAQNPVSRKGAIRVAMEDRLRAAASAGARVVIVRAGDYFGPRAGNNWFTQMVKPGRTPRAITYPGAPGVGHQWGYLPDVAETMVRLVEAERPERFGSYHMAGHWDPDGTAMIAAIRRALGAPDLPVRRFPWPLVLMARPLVPLFRELAEMRYLWQRPVRLDNTRLVEAIGHEPHTPLEEAVRATLAGLGCLPGPQDAAAVAAREL